MSLYEQLAANFYRWEQRGRGVELFPDPVVLEPPFVPFPGHRLKLSGPGDSGLKPTFLSRLTDKVFRALQPTKEEAPAISDDGSEEPEPHWLGKEEPSLLELRLMLPQDLTVSTEAMSHFLSNVSLASNPLSLEFIGTAGLVSLQLVAHDEDADAVAEQLAGHFPEIIGQESYELLANAWGDPDDESERVVIEFALGSPFMLPLAIPGKADPFVGLAAALSELDEDEAGVYQVTFAPLSDPWEENVIAAVTRHDGKPFFDDGAELVKGAREKISRPLYGVVVRLAARAADLDRVWQIIRRMAAPLRLFSKHGGNELTPLHNDHYDHLEHCRDLLLRRSRRCGMILNLDELTGFVRFPTAAVRSKAFLRVDESTRAARPTETTRDGVCLGVNEHAGAASEVWLTTEQRVRHLHMIGASGSGKTTLMFNLLQQDIESGAGFALLDPHGDLVEKVLGIIPPERIDDVILLDPSDEQFIVPFNFLSAHSDFEKTLLASDLVAIFRAQSTSWGDQMNSVFGNAIRAFLESSEGGTLAGVRRFLLDSEWRDQFLKTVTDPDVVFYWKRGFPQLGGNKSIGPILTRLETFLSPKPIRYMVSQRENRLDFAEMMDSGKIFLAKLPQGQMGKENAYLLGSLLVAKLQQMAMSRQRMDTAKRRPFFVYADEFQNFISPSMAEILSGARKYRIGFIVGHQDLRQLDRDKEVASAVLSNAFTRIVFRVSDSDARSLADGFAHFQAKQLQNLPIGKAICRIERADNDFNLTVPLFDEPDEDEASERRREVIEASRARYATPRAEVEAQQLQRRTDDLLPKEGAPPKVEVKPEGASPSISKRPELAISTPAESREVPSPAPLESMTTEPEQVPEKFGPGKGGHQHQLLQDRIKDAAEKKGFRAFQENPTGTGKETVDVALIRADIRIACEVSVTTTIDHEVGNARKCLRDNFHLVALVTVGDRRRAQLSQAIADHFAPPERKRIRCFSPDEFIAYLHNTPDQKPPAAGTVRGWKVKRKFTKLAPWEWAAKTKAAFNLLDREMKLPPEV